MKAEAFIIILLLAMSVLFIGCNNSADMPDVVKTDSVVAVDSAKAAVDTTAVNHLVDSLIKRPVDEKKSALLGYSYFRHMKQDETRNIYVYVQAVNGGTNINRLADSIKNDLIAANSQVKAERKSDTASYFTNENIFFYRYLTITLTDPGDNFKIDSLGIKPRQYIDSNENNAWQWAVTPKTSVKYARLVLQVMAEREDGTQKPIGTREIAVDIELETNFWRTLITWLRNNPEKLLVLILIPLAVYFGKRILERKKIEGK